MAGVHLMALPQKLREVESPGTVFINNANKGGRLTALGMRAAGASAARHGKRTRIVPKPPCRWQRIEQMGVRRQNQVKELSIPALPEEIQMRVHSPEDFWAVQLLQAAQKNPACEMLHLNKQVRPECLSRTARAAQKPPHRHKAALAFKTDPAHGMARHFSKIAIHQKNIHAAHGLLRTAPNTAATLLFCLILPEPAFLSSREKQMCSALP